MNKVCCISDIHLGCHSDSENWHNITLQWGEWLKNQLIDNNIDDIIMCGDFFDNRNEIGVNTLAVASKLMDCWNDFNITMILGNHDMFYKNRNDVNSISIFDGRDNVDVISEITEDIIGDKHITYLPWGSDISKCRKTDIIFGHLEINGFKMMPGRIAEGKSTPRSLTSKAKLIFSGHFHIRDERKYASSTIIYVGSPYQINWGESSNDCGFYIVDIDNMNYNFFENTISPKHTKIELVDGNFEDIEGNIISVEIDSSLDDVEIEKIKRKIYKENPLEVKFTILRDEYCNSDDGDDKHVDNVNVLENMMKFVDGLDLNEMSPLVENKLTDLYNKYAN